MMTNEIPLRIGQRIPQGDWPEDAKQEFIGGNECWSCGGIFIGMDGRYKCKECAAVSEDQSA